MSYYQWVVLMHIGVWILLTVLFWWMMKGKK